MRRRTWRSWLPLTFLILSILFLALHETRILAPVEQGLQVVLAPLQRATTALVRDVGNLFQTVREVRELRARVTELEEQVNTLTIENVRLREYEAEVVQLRGLLGFVEANPTWAFLGADVVGRSACINAPCGEVVGQEPNPYLRTITINVGQADGVAVGMPVVTGGAVLVGRVVETGLHTSKVRLITDTGHSVAAILQQSRATGLVVGQADGSLRLLYVPQEDTVQVGDIVLTSGLGGAFPRGLVLGQVVQVVKQDFALFQEAVVNPAVDYRRVELTLVIRSFQPLVQEEPGE
ncbi:MAG: rod shape-determining protein MreC [Thermoflexales bacterium]|nr:rod shape-determining protein MreC [Thermoflexales bacterium]